MKARISNRPTPQRLTIAILLMFCITNTAYCIDGVGLTHTYYRHSDAWGLPVFGRGHGLVQPLCAQLGTVQHHGNRLLSRLRSTRRSALASPKSGTLIRAPSSPRPIFWSH